jgi:hypothetical protein
LLSEADFWEMPVAQPDKYTTDGKLVIQVDGDEWVLEGVDERRYHVVERDFPKDEPSFQAACLCLLLWSGLEIPDEDLEAYGIDVELASRCD